MNSNNYNCLVKLAESGPVLPDFSDSARELMKLSPEVARRVLRQNPDMFSDADRVGLSRLLTENPARSSDVLPELAELSHTARNTVYNNIPNSNTNWNSIQAAAKPEHHPTPEPEAGTFESRFP
jgi:hypothetical protein